MGALILPNPTTVASRVLVKSQERLAALLVSHQEVTAEQFIGAAILAANAMESEVSPTSLLYSCWHLAKAGLLPDSAGSPWGMAYLVPFKKECTAIVGYRGYIELAYRSKFLQTLFADVVCQGEEFEYWRDESGPRLIHKPAFDREPDKKNIVAAYCHYQTEGGPEVAVISKKQIDKVYNGAKTKKVWNPHFAAMCKKTAVRVAAKNFRLTAAMAHAVRLDEDVDRTGRVTEPEDAPKPEADVTLDSFGEDAEQ